MTVIRIRLREEGPHTRLRVFVGEPDRTFALAGTLAMYPHEAEAFLAALRAGAHGPVGSDNPVEIGVDDAWVVQP
jgi:hypothetical protein